jgi:hypothetical protein
MICSTVWKVISVYDGDDRMADAHAVDRFCQFVRLIGIQWRGSFLGTDSAEAAAAGADLSGDHECRSPAAPTIVDIRATSFLTDRVQSMLMHV